MKAGQSASRAGTFIPLVPPVPAGQMRIVFTWQSLMVDKKLGQVFQRKRGQAIVASIELRIIPNKVGKLFVFVEQDLELHMTFQGSPTQKCHVYAGNPRCGDAVLTPNYLSGGGYGVEHILLTKIKKSKYTVWYRCASSHCSVRAASCRHSADHMSAYRNNTHVCTLQQQGSTCSRQNLGYSHVHESIECLHRQQACADNWLKCNAVCTGMLFLVFGYRCWSFALQFEPC